MWRALADLLSPIFFFFHFFWGFKAGLLLLLNKTSEKDMWQARGRVNEGGRKLPLRVVVASTKAGATVLRCTNADGFKVTVRGRRRAGAAAEATLADGTRLACVLGDHTRKGFLRIDAVDQDNFAWFWLELLSG